MSPVILLLLLAVLAASWFVISRRRQASDTGPVSAGVAAPARDTTFHAVSIKYGATACDSARELAGQRFLASDAPRLPLRDCVADRCECRFVHHDDRRSGRDRRSPFRRSAGLDGTGAFAEEQRDGQDRRRDHDEII